MSKTRLIFVIGPTNAGKGALLDAVTNVDPDGVGLVEVGKLFRAKYLDPKSPFYDPDYFKGQAAPAHTAAEAWNMMVVGVNANIVAGRSVILIDGQPRDVDQVNGILNEYGRNPTFSVEFAHVYAPESLRQKRAQVRDANDEAKLKLSMQRMQGDLIKIYEVLTRLINNGAVVHTIYNDGNTELSTFAHALLDHELEFGRPIRSDRLTGARE